MSLLLVSFLFQLGCSQAEKKKEERRPNFIILMSDNHSWDHLGCYGDPVIQTPNIDKLAAEGIRFTQAYCSAPSCAPARASMLTGQDIWRLDEAANLWGDFPPQFEVFTKLLEESGYLVGHEGKGWGPGDWEAGGRTENPAGTKYYSFEEFYNDREKGQPFFYWFSSRDPHRPFKADGWKKGKIDIDKLVVPPYLPDVEDVRKDIGDYYAEIENFDRDVSSYIQLLKEMGQLDNTLILVCSDNGWQMPRGLGNLYDFGTRLPFVISMPKRFAGGRVVDDFVSLNDVAPTFLELAGVEIPEEMNARSFANILESDKDGQVDATRDFVVTARERHAFARKNGTGYGARSYRTHDYLYIRNYNPEYWPAGDPPLFGDVDAHMLQYPCPTKMYILKNRDKEGVSELFDLGFGKRPAEELYDLNKDPFQMNNVAGSEEYKAVKDELATTLTNYLKEQGDPRETGAPMKWLNAPYYAEKDKYPTPSEEAIRELGLKEEYSLVDE
ncbi:Arylsulfatase A [Mariniphaga anaerophila]|uniref:Arylsulfatase A n=2 Tax=Mariniphaga anaerophila TaxID=1484053 RepID=A0A1M4WLP5_9BACT|nr:Arylsulfatase A [Mariniphaga anaerophila]